MNQDNVRVWLYSMIKVRPWTRHSLILVIIGLAHVTIGVSYLYLEEGGPRMRMLVVALNVAPIEFWSIVFMLVGAFIILSSIWPAHYEKWGYSVATGLATSWSAMYFAGVFFQNNYYGSNISMGFVFALIAFLYWGISGLVNPDDIAIVVMDDERD